MREGNIRNKYSRRRSKAGVMIRMAAMAAACIFGAMTIAASPKENPSTTQIRRSLEEGQKAIENKGSFKAAVTDTPNSPAAVFPGETEAVNNRIDESEYNEADDIITYEEYLREQKDNGSVTAIGDSVMLGAAEALQNAIPGINVDAKQSRQMYAAIDIADQMEKNGELGDTVIIALGTNGPFSQEKGQELVDAIGEDREIYWVLSYGQGDALGYQDSVNETIEEIAADNANVTIVDWPSIAEENPDWIYPDGIHLAPKGQTGYAEMIRDAIGI